MIYQNNTFEYRMNLAAFRDMEEVVPMTKNERSQFTRWVLNGHDSPMNYLKALRIRCGYSHGPWDSWEYAVYLILHSENDEQRETIW